MAHIELNGKKKYYRDRGEDYTIPDVITLNEEDICPICQWEIGSKKVFMHSDGTLTHDRNKCRMGYMGYLTTCGKWNKSQLEE